MEVCTVHPIQAKRIKAAYWCGALAVSASFITGCTQPSLLLTPVNVRRTLVETELSRDSRWAKDKIVLIDVTGSISNAPKLQLLGQGEHPVSLLLEQLDKARRDRRVKGVILRINSPGGTVVASELMHDEIMHFKKSGKPVISVMMDTATSGAYYIACACDKILAQPSTVTGSIGVIMQMFDLTGTMKLVGVEGDAITSGQYKDIGSPLRTMTPEEREMFQQIVNDMYERFVDVVVAGRPRLDEAAVRRLADGRVYSATQALEAGLIDRIASLREATEMLKERVGSKRVRLVAYQRPLGYRPNYYAQAPATPGGDINLLKFELPTLLEHTTPQFLYQWIPRGH